MFFFTQRVVSTWKVLPGVLVEADTIRALKRFLDRHVDMLGMEGYGSHAGRDSLVSCSAHCGLKGLLLYCAFFSSNTNTIIACLFRTPSYDPLLSNTNAFTLLLVSSAVRPQHYCCTTNSKSEAG